MQDAARVRSRAWQPYASRTRCGHGGAMAERGKEGHFGLRGMSERGPHRRRTIPEQRTGYRYRDHRDRSWARNLPQGVYPPRRKDPGDDLRDRRDTHAPVMSAWRQTLRGERAALGRSARRFAFGAHVSRSQAATAGGLRYGKQPFAKSFSESVPAGRANFPPCSSRLTDAGPTKSAEQATAGA